MQPAHQLLYFGASLGIALLAISCLERGLGRNDHEGLRRILLRNGLVILLVLAGYLLIGADLMMKYSLGRPWWLAVWDQEVIDKYWGVREGSVSVPLMVLLQILTQASFPCAAAVLMASAVANTGRKGKRPPTWLILCSALAFSLFTYPLFGLLHWNQGLISRLGFVDVSGAIQIYGLGGCAALGWLLFQPRPQALPSVPVREGGWKRWLCLGLALLILGSSYTQSIRRPMGGEHIVELAAPMMLYSAPVALVTAICLRTRLVPAMVIGVIAGATSQFANRSAPSGLAIWLSEQTVFYLGGMTALIAMIAAALAVIADWLLRRLRFNDPVAAFPAFAVGGFVGVASVAFTGTTAFVSPAVSAFSGGAPPPPPSGRLWVQLLGILLGVLWAGGTWAVMSVAWTTWRKTRELGADPRQTQPQG